MLGKVYNNPVNKNDEPLYGIGIDAIIKQVLTLVLLALGYKTINEASKHVIVEQHRDAETQSPFHILFS